jgi:hypothetical protein
MTISVASFSLSRIDTGSPGSEFAGFGAQYNQNLYAAISRDAGATDAYALEVQRRLGVLKPQFVRIFFQGEAFADDDLMQSFVRTVKLAQRTAATINVTFQGIGPRAHKNRVPAFAEVLAGLASEHDKLRWVTVRNEPNRPAMPKELYLDLYRQLDRELRRLGVRDQIRVMGGDLLFNKQQEWFDFLATREMAGLLDAYSIHVYWDYRSPAKIANRLTGVKEIWKLLPANRRKPLYVTEYGARGSAGSQPKPNPGFLADNRTPLGQTNINAFQHAWFALLSAKLGFLGSVKWDAYFSRYGTGVPAQTMAFWLVGPPGTAHPSPIYELMRLFSMTVAPGARVVDFAADREGSVVVGFAGPNERLTVLGLDTRGGLPSAPAGGSSYSFANLPAGTEFQLRYWNRGGRGRTVTHSRVRSDATGALTVEAPVQSVFAITSLPPQ